MQRRLVDQRALELLRNRALKLVSRPGESAEDFARRCDEAAQAAADAEAAKIRDRLEAKQDRLEAALAEAQRRVEQLDTDAKTRQANEVIAGAGAVLGALLGGRRSTRSMAGALSGAASRRGMSSRAASRRKAAEEKTADVRDDLAELEQEILDEVAEIDERWREVGRRHRDGRDPPRGDGRPRARDAARVGSERLTAWVAGAVAVTALLTACGGAVVRRHRGRDRRGRAGSVTATRSR